MSKWTEVRDGVVSALDISDVAESAKNQMIESLTSDGMDAIDAIAAKFVAQIQTQASNETGWSALRDRIVLPLLINGTIWAMKIVLSKSAKQAGATKNNN